MEKEILRLFKGYYEECDDGIISESFSEKALKYGLLIGLPCSEKVIDEAIRMYGKDGKKWNQTFHKDFEIVKNAPIEDLIAQQLLHYYTTYGFEDLDIYNQDTVYIPREKLEIPELKEDIELIVIKMLQKKDLEEKLMTLLVSGIALSEQTIKDIMVLSNFINKDKFDEIKNREIKIALYDKYNIMPKNPDEFLRFLLFKTTNETLKIQNVKMIYSIKNGNKEIALKMLKSYIESNGYVKLSSIFLRNKNLFLAFKIDKEDKINKNIKTEMNAIINKLRKFAIDNHKPLNKNILDCLTDVEMIKKYNYNQLAQLLDKITIFREIRILNGILYRLNNNGSIVYRIRNGKSYVKQIKKQDEKYFKILQIISEDIKGHLINRLKKQVEGKTIYIPENVVYAAPTSEKQFSGNIPNGSYLEIPRNDNLVYGVYWKNIENSNIKSSSWYGEETLPGQERVDIDLKQMNKSEIFGWDASYRSESGNILFSGDMTDAKLPNGASELFYIDKNYGHGAFLITLNMYTDNSQDIPFEFVIANATHKPNERVYYVLDPNNILEKVDMVIKKDERQKVVGFITIGDSIRFYFNDFSAGGDIKTPRGGSTSTKNEITMGAFDYLQTYNKVQLKLNSLLEDAGAKIVNKPIISKTIMSAKIDDKVIEETKEFPVDIDLSINSINKESLIKLFNESDK